MLVPTDIAAEVLELDAIQGLEGNLVLSCELALARNVSSVNVLERFKVRARLLSQKMFDTCLSGLCGRPNFSCCRCPTHEFGRNGTFLRSCDKLNL